MVKVHFKIPGCASWYGSLPEPHHLLLVTHLAHVQNFITFRRQLFLVILLTERTDEGKNVISLSEVMYI